MKFAVNGGVLFLLAALSGSAAAEDIVVGGVRLNELGFDADIPFELTVYPRNDGAHPEWGGANIVKSIQALSFQESLQGNSPGIQTFTYVTTGPGVSGRHNTGGDFDWFDAALDDLPAGAHLQGLVLEACDTNATSGVTLALFVSQPAVPTSLQLPATVATGGTPAPGCGTFGTASNIASLNLFIDNQANNYFLRVGLGADDSSTSFRSVRVYYRLRVSPAPGAARFVDVPTNHIFFQWIEALAASGITGGCTSVPGGFCPNDPVTRAQMAVFLATALGLHFPN